MKSYMAVVVAVVMAAGMVIGTAGAVLADSEGAGVYGTTNSSERTNLERVRTLRCKRNRDRSAVQCKPERCPMDP